MATFPAYPVLLFDPTRRRREAGVVRTPKEGGLPKQRKRFSRVMIARPVTYLLKSASDYASFMTWYETTIGRTGWFDWTDPADGVVKQARIQGGAIEDEEPQRKSHDRWKVKFTIETWNT